MVKNKRNKLLLWILCLSTVLAGCGNGGQPSSATSAASEPEVSAVSSDIEVRQEKDDTLEEELTEEEQTTENEEEPDLQTTSVQLNSGYDMPRIGLGTFTLDQVAAENSTYHALLNGYRLIDTAKYYGNEEGVGRGVRRAMEEGIVTREEVFVTTKILPNGYSDYAAVIEECNETLGLGYIDLMLIHTRGSDEIELYRAIEEAIEIGTVRSLGISNYYTQEEFDQITENATILPAVIQNENHPFHQNTVLQEYVSQYGVFIESYYPFGGRGHTQDLFTNETITEIAQAHNKTAPQILVRWHFQAGYIVIPGSSNPEHIAENIDIFDFELSDDEMNKIAAMNTGVRYESW